jgi:hypothetical protein
MSLPAIKTSHIWPPIPCRNSDWCAFYDGTEETGKYGYGAAEQEAIDDLVSEYEEYFKELFQ